MQKLDWSRMPRDARVTRLSVGGCYYIGRLKDDVCAHWRLLLSKGAEGDYYGHHAFLKDVQDDIKLLPDLDWRPWLGGECPVPEGVMAEIKYRIDHSNIKLVTEGAKLNWNWIGGSFTKDIIAYKITGLADGFTT